MVKILLVEDSPHTIEAYTLMLTPEKVDEDGLLDAMEASILGGQRAATNNENDLGEIELIIATTLEDAMLLFDEEQPDIVITDHQFPNEEGFGTADNGFIFIKHVRDNSSKHIPVIWNSSGCSDETLKDAKEKHGADHAFRKPVDTKAFKLAIKSEIDKLKQAQGSQPIFTGAVVNERSVGLIFNEEITPELKERVAATIAANAGISIEDAREIGTWQPGLLMLEDNLGSGFNQQTFDMITNHLGSLMTPECSREFRTEAAHFIGSDVIEADVEGETEILPPERPAARSALPTTKSTSTVDCAATIVEPDGQKPPAR